MKLNFILPFFTPFPGGGIKIMYEYANRMSLLGYDVMIYNSINTPYFEYPVSRPLFVRKLITLVKYKNHPKPKWFQFNDKVQFKFIDDISDKTIRDADATITTWWSLVASLSKLDDSKGKKINLIQGYEIWEGNENLVHQSYNFEKVSNLVISKFLYNKVKEHNLHSEPLLTTNALDTNIFYTINLITERNPLSVCMVYSDDDIVKGTNYGLAALEKLKEIFPKLEVELFGLTERNERIPSWIKYNYNPRNLCEIYNRNAIFLAPNINEGWGLPPAEAMACGCALACTEIEGHKHHFVMGNAITLIPKSVDDIVEKMTILLNDNELRISLAEKSIQVIEKYSWKKVINRFIKVLKS